MFKFRKKQANPVAVAADLVSGRDVLAAMEPWLQEHRRRAWKPVVAAGEPAASASKFGGLSWLASDELAPVCGECGEELQLFVQLALWELPVEAGNFGEGVLQLYYCGARASECIGDGGFEAFASTVSVVRVVSKGGVAERPDEAGATPRFPVRSIVGWTEFGDVPGDEEQHALGFVSRFDSIAKTYTFTCDSFGVSVTVPVGEDDVVFDAMMPDDHDKLGGWPHWVQAAEYPSCTECGSIMRLVFQVASDDNVPYMFGDVGIGHVTQCPTHLDVVAFAWACS